MVEPKFLLELLVGLCSQTHLALIVAASVRTKDLLTGYAVICHHGQQAPRELGTPRAKYGQHQDDCSFSYAVTSNQCRRTGTAS
jgi:hypothetical protein